MRVLGGESATWALRSWGRGWTDGQRDRVRGSLGGLGHAPATRPPLAPQECGGGGVRRSQGYQKHGSILPGLSSGRISSRAALPTHISPPDYAPHTVLPELCPFPVRAPSYMVLPELCSLPHTVHKELCPHVNLSPPSLLTPRFPPRAVPQTLLHTLRPPELCSPHIQESPVTHHEPPLLVKRDS